MMRPRVYKQYVTMTAMMIDTAIAMRLIIYVTRASPPGEVKRRRVLLPSLPRHAAIRRLRRSPDAAVYAERPIAAEAKDDFRLKELPL